MYVDKKELPENLAKEVPLDEKLWTEFLKCVFTDEQISELKEALKAGKRVYFYGASLGKSTLADLLLKAGFKASEPGMCMEGRSLITPNGENVAAFRLKEPREYIFGNDIREALLANIEAVRLWVNL